MAKSGAFTFVLHSHLPYCRLAGRWPHGEEWLHEAASETYLPLLDSLYDLRDEGIDFHLTVGITPVLVEQLADPLVLEHLVLFLEQRISYAEQDVARFRRQGDPHAEYLAGFYRDWYRHGLEVFQERFGGDIVGAFATLQREGYLEIATSAATHGYLPLLTRESSIYGQLRTGVECYKRHFGRAPRVVWLPECAYRPAYVNDVGVVRPGIEEFLSLLDLGCFFSETHAIEGSRPVGKAAGDVSIGPYAAINRRYVVPVPEGEKQTGTTFQPYYVAGTSGLTDPAVAVIARDNRTGRQVWSAELGYPGDKDYREFHKKDHISGLQYWRVTGPGADLGDKDFYHPDWAQQRVAEHARHFVDLVEGLLGDYRSQSGKFGLISSNYDTELFGHWWFEGVAWVKQVLRLLSGSEVVELTSTSDYLERHPPEEAVALPESSWGSGGGHWTWDNPDTHWMWQPIREAEERMEQMATRHSSAEGIVAEILDQAARELLLLQSSDWPFLVSTGQASQYAIQRFRSHTERFNRLLDAMESESPETAGALAEEYNELDNVFPDMDFRWFREQDPSALKNP